MKKCDYCDGVTTTEPGATNAGTYCQGCGEPRKVALDLTDPYRCPGSPDGESWPHKWDDTTEPVTCSECGAGK